MYSQGLKCKKIRRITFQSAKLERNISFLCEEARIATKMQMQFHLWLAFFQFPAAAAGDTALAKDKPMNQPVNEAGRLNFVVVLWRQMKVNWFKEIARGGDEAARWPSGSGSGTAKWQ